MADHREANLRLAEFLVRVGWSRLARESGDAALGAGVLVGMSHQALMLGYPREALRLAITGRHGIARADNPVGAAGLWAAQAQAHAALGDATAAVRAVIESERAFESIDTEPDAAGIASATVHEPW